MIEIKCVKYITKNKEDENYISIKKGLIQGCWKSKLQKSQFPIFRRYKIWWGFEKNAIKFHGDLKQKISISPFKILWGECSIWLHSPPLFFLNQIHLFLHQMMFLDHLILSLLNHCILYSNHIFYICFESTVFYFVYVQSSAFHYRYI